MTDYAPILEVGASELPVSLAEVKQHLRVDHSDDDGILTIYLNAAVAHLDGLQGWLGRALVTQTWSQQFDRFARCFRLGLAQVSGIVSVVYLDTAGVERTVDSVSYELVNASRLPDLVFADNYSFPSVQDQRPVLTVTFTAGYGAAVAVPAPIKAAILLMVGDMYLSREGQSGDPLQTNPTVRRFLDPYRTRWVA